MQYDEYNKIKKKYGEAMAQFCRSKLVVASEYGSVYDCLVYYFPHANSLYNDIVNDKNQNSFVNFINEKIGVVDRFNNIKNSSDKNPFELIKQAGYTLYECKTNDQLQQFSKYYKLDEVICSMRDEYRTSDKYVFMAVKHNATVDGVAGLTRSDFDANGGVDADKSRHDDYSISVISIQFSKENPSEISIISRYNHTVKNPDSLFGSNPDNIINGLTSAFANYLGVDYSCNFKPFEMHSYVKDNKGRFFKYNTYVRDNYFCENNVVITNGIVKKYMTERYVLAGYYLIDIKERTIKSLVPGDCFENTIGNINKIEVKKSNGGKTVTFTTDFGVSELGLDSAGGVLSYYNPYATKIDARFMYMFNYLGMVEMPSVTVIGDRCMSNAESIQKASFKSAKKVGRWCGSNCNFGATTLEFDSLEEVDNYFFDNALTTEISFGKLKKTGSYFCSYTRAKYINLPNIVTIGNFSLLGENVEQVNTPKLVVAGNSFLKYATNLREYSAPSLRRLGDCALENAVNLKQLYIPLLYSCGECVLGNNLLLAAQLKNYYTQDVSE